MNKILIIGVMVISAVTALWGMTATNTPRPEGSELWTYISETETYTEWKHWPGYDGIYPGQSPHGAYLKMYVNTAAYQALEKGELPLPPGSIIVKENYGRDKETLKAVTPMFKVPGYNPDGGDWFWAKYGADGSVKASGKVKSCMDCHSAKRDHDWLFSKIK